MSNTVFGKIMENVRKHWHVKLATTKIWRSYVVSEPTYCTKKIFTENLLLIEMKKKKNRNNLLISLSV